MSTTEQGNNALQSFQASILDLDNSLTEMRESGSFDVQSACEAYSLLSGFKSQIGVLMNDHENFLLEILKQAETEAVMLQTGQSLTVEYSKSRKAWRHKDLAEVVASRIQNLAYDIDTGERKMTTSEMITKLLDYVQPSYWRVTSLSEIGVSADEYCESGETEAKIRLGKAK